jgi:hypothetical protein
MASRPASSLARVALSKSPGRIARITEAVRWGCLHTSEDGSGHLDTPAATQARRVVFRRQVWQRQLCSTAGVFASSSKSASQGTGCYVNRHVVTIYMKKCHYHLSRACYFIITKVRNAQFSSSWSMPVFVLLLNHLWYLNAIVDAVLASLCPSLVEACAKPASNHDLWSSNVVYVPCQLCFLGLSLARFHCTLWPFVSSYVMFIKKYFLSW